MMMQVDQLYGSLSTAAETSSAMGLPSAIIFLHVRQSSDTEASSTHCRRKKLGDRSA